MRQDFAFEIIEDVGAERDVFEILEVVVGLVAGEHDEGLVIRVIEVKTTEERGFRGALVELVATDADGAFAALDGGDFRDDGLGGFITLGEGVKDGLDDRLFRFEGGFLEGFFEAFLEFGAAFYQRFRQGAQGGEDIGLELAAFVDFRVAGGFVLFLESGKIGEGFGRLQAGEAFFGDLEIEAQRAVDLDAALTETGGGEDLDVVGFLPRGEVAEDGVF